jgi:hypothetical protein
MLYDSELKNMDNMSESVSVTSAVARQIDNFDSDIDLEIKRNVKGAPNLNMRNIDAVSDSDDLNVSSAKSGESSFAKQKKEKANTLKLSKDSLSSQSNKSSMNSDVSSLNINESVFRGMDSDVSVDFRRKKTGKK